MQARRFFLIAAALAAAAPANAAPFFDAAGDFIPSYTGPQNPDLDVLRSEVFVGVDTFEFTALLNGAIGTTPGGFYVFGVDRGMGTARFGAIATNVLFDAVVVVNSNGTGFARDLIAGVTNVLAPGAISLTGNSLSATVDRAFLPTRGFDQREYTYNLWPRSPGAGNATIADFAPDNANARVTDVPQPASLALMAGLLGAGGLIGRRRAN